jgi:hypothetical protein
VEPPFAGGTTIVCERGHACGRELDRDNSAFQIQPRSNLHHSNTAFLLRLCSTTMMRRAYYIYIYTILSHMRSLLARRHFSSSVVGGKNSAKFSISVRQRQFKHSLFINARANFLIIYSIGASSFNQNKLLIIKITRAKYRARCKFPQLLHIVPIA